MHVLEEDKHNECWNLCITDKGHLFYKRENSKSSQRFILIFYACQLIQIFHLQYTLIYMYCNLPEKPIIEDIVEILYSIRQTFVTWSFEKKDVSKIHIWWVNLISYM